ncbi:site-specific integrase [Salibaculum griseiflavum]|uniref:Tyr recombinase domain-containing protein n=1 Tax=Salibaculum griseiflavum TaxID=1914409 RepID=A0A2V1P2W7_9RHOB|nr:hypothetical protein [Salibaculum griseiflavum]PWG16184.1 hypothetical protein DFK10_12630 [Salibaculum griseiflavum]
MGTKHQYLPTTLVQIPSKGNKWFVVATKPLELQTGKNIQRRVSTKTTDRREAGRRWHEIEAEIWANFDKQIAGLSDSQGKIWAEEFAAVMGYESAGPQDQYAWRKLQNAAQFILDNPSIHTEAHYYAALNFVTFEVEDYARRAQGQPIDSNHLPDPSSEPDATPVDIKNRTSCPSILEWLPVYMADKKWSGVREKTKKSAENRIRACAKIIGNLPLDQIMLTHGHQIAEKLDEQGKANRTIHTYTNNLSLLLDHAVAKAINTTVTPNQHFLSVNPIKGLSLRGYGSEKRSWEALEEDQLYALFAQDMPDTDRLLLSILLTTGMREDEAALLKWEQLKTDRNGIRYFDLSIGAVVKNDKFSARTVALPDCLKLPEKGTGRIFPQWQTDLDGKASNKVSKHLNVNYFHPVRYGPDDDRKVVHSLRHNLTGLMLNLTDPAPSSEHMDWITGHGMEGSKSESERQRTYRKDPDVLVKYNIVNRIKHPWLK